MADINKHIFGNATAYSVEKLICILGQLSDNIATLHTHLFADFKALSKQLY